MNDVHSAVGSLTQPVDVAAVIARKGKKYAPLTTHEYIYIYFKFLDLSNGTPQRKSVEISSN